MRFERFRMRGEDYSSYGVKVKGNRKKGTQETGSVPLSERVALLKREGKKGEKMEKRRANLRKRGIGEEKSFSFKTRKAERQEAGGPRLLGTISRRRNGTWRVNKGEKPRKKKK